MSYGKVKPHIDLFHRTSVAMTDDDIDPLFLRTGSSETADAPLVDLIAWIRERK